MDTHFCCRELCLQFLLCLLPNLVLALPALNLCDQLGLLIRRLDDLAAHLLELGDEVGVVALKGITLLLSSFGSLGRRSQVLLGLVKVARRALQATLRFLERLGGSVVLVLELVVGRGEVGVGTLQLAVIVRQRAVVALERVVCGLQFLEGRIGLGRRDLERVELLLCGQQARRCL